MRNSSQGKPLEPIGGLIEVPCAVVELGDGHEAYICWDSAWSEFHDSPEDVRALTLAAA